MEIYKELKLYSRYKSAFMFCSILSGVLTFLTMMLLILFIYKTNNTILYISIVILGLNLLSIIFSLLNLKHFLIHQKRYLSLLMREENS